MDLATLRDLTAAFPANRFAAAKGMRGFYVLDPPVFVELTLQLLRETAMTEPKENSGGMYLLAMLLALPDALTHLCDPTRFSPIESLALVCRVKVLDPQVETKLARLAVQFLPYDTDRQTELGVRILQVLSAASNPITILPAMRQLLQAKHMRIRSQAALLIGRISRNPQWVKRFDMTEDPRVVANAIESLWGLNTQAARDAFLEASRDPRNRVAGNGAIGLYLAGDLRATAAISRTSRHDDSRFRSTAAWCMGRSGDVRFLPRLRALARDGAASGRTQALRSLQSLTQRLHSLQQSPEWPVVIRRAAVHEADIQLQIELDNAGPHTRGFGPLDFVLSLGGDLIETYSVQEVRKEASRTVYEIVCPVDTAAPPNQGRALKVEFYHDKGCGSVIVADGSCGNVLVPEGIKLETCGEPVLSCAPLPAPPVIRLPARWRLRRGVSWRG